LALLECKKVTAQKSNVQTVFEDCLKQVLDDKKNEIKLGTKNEPKVKMNLETKDRKKMVTLKARKWQKRNSEMVLEGNTLIGSQRIVSDNDVL